MKNIAADKIKSDFDKFMATCNKGLNPNSNEHLKLNHAFLAGLLCAYKCLAKVGPNNAAQFVEDSFKYAEKIAAGDLNNSML